MIVRSMLLSAFFVLVLNAIFPLTASAENLPDHKVSIQQDKIGLRDALTSLLDETKFKYKLSNNVTNDKQISIDAIDKTWDEVFKYILSEGNLSYRITAKRRILVSP